MIELPVYISLGAGVQSSTMALMAALGELKPMPKGAIFADTQGEPDSVYTWLEWLIKELNFPVHIVSKGNLGQDELRIVRSKKSGKLYRKQSIPAFVAGAGLYPRKCTIDYKILPVRRELKKLEGLPRVTKDARINLWLGISTDEAHRMKDSQVPYIVNNYPLIDYGFSRTDCLNWMKQKGYPEPPRSACYFCPFHSSKEWQRLKEFEPNEFAKAVAFEKVMQEANLKSEVAKGIPYLHSSKQPLELVDFNKSKKDNNGFGNECEGMCGL